jgi:hypothetical protein
LTGFITFAFVALAMQIVGSSKILASLNATTLKYVMYFGLLALVMLVSAGVGNVWRWCQDWWEEGYYAKSPAENPEGPEHGNGRVLRGGSWEGTLRGCRSADRWRNQYFRISVGIRVVVAASAFGPS